MLADACGWLKPCGQLPSSMSQKATLAIVLAPMQRPQLPSKALPIAEPNPPPRGPSNVKDGEGALLTLQFAGLDGTFPTDIATNYPNFRRRGPWRGFFDHHRIAAGDAVAIERLSPYEYRVLPLILQGRES
jgi:hypothetical protein